MASKLSGETPTYFNTNEMKIILSDHLRNEDYSTWFLVYCLYHTGARVSELVGDYETKNGIRTIIHQGVYVKDIDFHNRVIRIKTLKRENHTRFVPLQPDTVGSFAAWVTDQGLTKESKLFPFGRKAAYNRVKKASEEAGFNDPPAERKGGKAIKSRQRRNLPHSMRHSFAIAAIASGVPLLTVSEWLGHQDIANTLIYVKMIAKDSAHFINQVRF